MDPASDSPTISAEILAKRRDNATSRLCALPSELIVPILLDVRDGRLEPSSPLAPPSEWLSVDWMAWLPITHVCHRIRAVALALPSLWDHVYVRNQDAAAAFLDRSGAAPLDMWVDRRAALPVVDAALGQLPRMRSLLLDNLSSNLRESREGASWVGTPAPNLVSLAICQRNGHETQWTPIPELLLCSYMPSLQSLDAESSGWRWMDAVFPNTLTRLSVCTGFPWMHSMAAAEKTLSVLRGLSCLEFLSILDPIPSDEDEEDLVEEAVDDSAEGNDNEIVSTPVSLPRLQSLTCSGAFPPCLRLLDRLIIPSTCKVCIRIGSLANNFSHVPMLVALLNKNVCAADAHAPPLVELSLSVCDNGYGPLYVRGFRTERTPPTPGTSAPDADFMLECHITSDEDAVRWKYDYVLYDVVGALDLPSVRTLELHDLGAIRPLGYYALHHMVGLETIRFCHDWTFLAVLLTFNKADDDESQIFLPQLRRLVFSHVDFAPGQYDLCGARFAALLRTRRERGAGIATIVLRCCVNVAPELAAMIRSEVGEVCEETCSPMEHMNMLAEQRLYGLSELGALKLNVD